MSSSCGEENSDRNTQKTDFLKHGTILQETAMAGTLIHLFKSTDHLRKLQQANPFLCTQHLTYSLLTFRTP